MTVTGTVAASNGVNVAQARPPAERFELGEWRVDPATNRLSHPDGEQPLEPRAMAVLLALCEVPGEVVSADALLVRCWGDALVEGGLGDNPVHKSINQLRRALGDSATAPRYIETIRKRGYRVIAPVRGGQGQARTGAWQGGSPFRGLQAFDARHAEVFFGRELATQELLRSVTLQMQRQHGLVLVLGPSGSGKTSLVSAGLIPALYREPLAGHWQLLSHAQLDLADLTGQAPEESTPDQGPSPLALALAAALLDWETPSGEPLLAGFNAHDLAHALTRTPAAVLTELRAALQRSGGVGQSYALLFIDRLEALFRPPLGEESQREPALRLLQQLAESGCVLLVAACRNDYYPQLAQNPWLMRDKTQGGHLDLAPPSPAEIAQMVRLPARAAGLSFGIDPATQRRLDDLLCDAAAASPDALPLLQYTLEQLYQQRSPHGELSFAAYQALGGVSGGMGGLEGVIAEQAEQLIRGMTPVQQEALPHVLSLLVLVGEDETSPVGGRRALWSELGSAAERELVRALVDARLLVSEHSTEFSREEPSFRVAHEALLRRWPRVTDWIAQHRQDLQTRARLRQQVQRWEQGGRAVEFLWPRGRQLQDALALRRQGLLTLADGEQRFLDSCRRRAAWAGRLKGGAVAALVALTVLAGGMAWRAQQAEGVARERSAQADDLLGYMLGELADKLRPIGRLELLDSVGGKALGHLGAGTADRSARPEALVQRAKALNVISEVRLARGDLPGVQESATQAMQLLHALPPPADPTLEFEHQMVLGAAAFWRGQADYARGDMDGATASLQQYLRAAERMVALQPESPQAQVELSYALNSLGSADLGRGELAAAAEAFQRSAALKRKALMARPKDLAVQADLADTLSWWATTQERRGEYVDALALGRQRIEIESAVQAQAPQDLKWQHSLAIAHYMQGRIYKELGKAEEASAHLQKALHLTTALVASQPDQLAWQDTHFLSQLEWLELRALSPRQRLQELDQIEQTCRQVFSKALGRFHTQRLMAQLLHLRTRQWASLNEPVQERMQLQSLANQLAQISVSHSDLFEIGWRQAIVRLRLADLLSLAGKSQEGRALCEQVKASVKPSLIRQSLQWTSVWVHAAECLGQAAQVKQESGWLRALAERQTLQLNSSVVH